MRRWICKLLGHRLTWHRKVGVDPALPPAQTWVVPVRICWCGIFFMEEPRLI